METQAVETDPAPTESETTAQNASLEGRVRELESLLKESEEKRARDRIYASEDILKKNNVIDRMRVKLNRYEFALKEAILFLSKPMEAYESWITNRADGTGSAQTVLVAAMSRAISAAQQQAIAPPSPIPSRMLDQEGGRSRSASGTVQKPASVGNAMSQCKDGKSLSFASPNGTNTPVGTAIVPSLEKGGPAALEVPIVVQSLECMRLALNYLKNAQTSVLAMGKDDVSNALPSLSAVPAPPSLLSDQSRAQLELEIQKFNDGSAPASATGRSEEKGQRAAPQAATAKGSSRSSPLSGSITVEEAKGSAENEQAEQNPSFASVGTQTVSPAPNGYAHASVSTLQLQPTQTAKGKHARNLSTDRKASTAVTNQALMHAAAAVTEEDDGDITTTKAGAEKPSPTSPTNSPSSPINTGGPGPLKCNNCRDLMLQIEHQTDTIDQLRDDVKTLANQLEEERATIDRIQLSKDILDTELEELTAQLFDQANHMVIDEARMREELENCNRDLRGELRDLVQKCNNREAELKELRRNLRALEAVKTRSAGLGGSASPSPFGSERNLGPNGPYGNGNGAVSGLASSGAFEKQLGPYIPRGSVAHTFYSVTSLSTPKSSTYAASSPTSPSASAVEAMKSSSQLQVDGLLFSEFQDHIRQAALVSSMPPLQAMTHALGTAFMKRCLSEDVEPCLFYSYGKSSLPTAMRKKMTEALIRGGLDVIGAGSSSDPASPVNATAEELATALQRLKCTMCSLVRECDFKLRFSAAGVATVSFTPSQSASAPQPTLSISTQVETAPLCRFCRDRVVSVVDFYTFMAHLHHGLIGPGRQGLSILGMFRHAMWLRRRMAAGRVGCCSLFEPDVLHAVDRKGDGDWERFVHIVSNS